MLCLEKSNLARQLKFNPDVEDNRLVVIQMTASLWFRSMELTITGPISSARGLIKNMAGAEKQLELMLYRLTLGGRWPFLTPRLQNVTGKTRKTAPHLIEQICEFL